LSIIVLMSSLKISFSDNLAPSEQLPNSSAFPRLAQPTEDTLLELPSSKSKEQLPQARPELEERFGEIVDEGFSKFSASKPEWYSSLRDKFFKELIKDLKSKDFKVEAPERHVSEKVAQFLEAHTLPWRDHEVEKLLERFRGLIVARASETFSGDHERVKDLTQEIVLKIQRDGEGYNPTKARAVTFVSMITRNYLIDCLRRDEVRAEIDRDAHSLPPDYGLRDGGGESDGLSRVIIHDQLAAVLRTAETHLRPEEIMVLKLQFFEERSQSQIALLLEIPIGSVKSLQHRGMTKLRKLLSRQE